MNELRSSQEIRRNLEAFDENLSNYDEFGFTKAAKIARDALVEELHEAFRSER
jgi:hypothetical protein